MMQARALIYYLSTGAMESTSTYKRRQPSQLAQRSHINAFQLRAIEGLNFISVPLTEVGTRVCTVMW